MKLFLIFKIALRALRRNKLRTILTMLGIFFGVGAVILTVSIGAGAQAQVEQQIASLGRNVILLFSGSFTRGGVHSGWGGAGTLTIDDANSIRREIAGVTAVSPELRSATQIAAGNQNWFTTILGEGEEYLDIRQWQLATGAMFSEQDVRSASKVAIVGKTVATQLFGDSNPVGQVIRIKNVPFTIVGELIPKGLTSQGTDQDDVVIIPYTSAMKRILGTTTLRSMNIQGADASELAQIEQEITQLLREKHKITAGREDDFTIRTQQEIADMMTSTQKVLRIFLSIIALISLLVGGIGVMNIMLVSVTERTREIGIRMAVGARSRDILLQFIIEAVSLSALGGIIGIVLGMLTAELLSKVLGWPTLTSITAILASFSFSAFVGIAFGFYPAFKASRLNPIDALRYE